MSPLRHIWDSFKVASSTLLHWQTTLLLSVLYYLFVLPLALVQRMFVHKPVNGWQKWTYKNDTLDDLFKQY